MGFATSYLKRHQLFPAHISEPPSGLLNFIVVIPVYNEDNLQKTLTSLYNCERPKTHVEIILVFNSSETDTEKVKNQNTRTLNLIRNWLTEKNTTNFRFHILHFPDLPKKFAGAGLARKIGMDTAVSRFDQLDRKNGIILSLDADTLCSTNYFTAIESAILNDPDINGFTIYFEHSLSGDEFPAPVYQAITQYELHMRYYIEGLRYAGFPYAFHTVGSCFGVTAETYCKQGGMNRRQGGEDFYFLHKVIPQGKFTEINNTTLYPSSRPSSRVPFGTGPVIQKLMDSQNNELETFHPVAFDELKKFIRLKDKFFNKAPDVLRLIYEKLPVSICSFINAADFTSALSEINANCSSSSSFIKRFYQWFNAFRVFKFLNHASSNFFPKKGVSFAANELLKKFEYSGEYGLPHIELLKIYRNYQRHHIHITHPSLLR